MQRPARERRREAVLGGEEPGGAARPGQVLHHRGVDERGPAVPALGHRDRHALQTGRGDPREPGRVLDRVIEVPAGCVGHGFVEPAFLNRLKAINLVSLVN